MAGSGSRGFRSARRSEKHAMIPIESFIDERYGIRPTAAKNNRGQWHALRFLPVGIDDRTLRCCDRKSRVRLRTPNAGVGRPGVALPINSCGRRRADPRIAERILAALGEARSVLNLGAGAGSYEPTDRWVLAVEPTRSTVFAALEAKFSSWLAAHHHA